MLRKLFGFISILVGFISISIAGTLISRYNSPVDYTLITRSDIVGPKFPILVEFVELNKTLPVTQSEILNGKWQDPGNTLGYWINSATPGSKGNVVFYGHNRPSILGDLGKLKNDDLIRITMSDTGMLTYKVVNKYEVTKDQVHILNQTDDPIITIYTCSGFLDSKRLVITAVLEDI